jgi:hypothetical protein
MAQVVALVSDLMLSSRVAEMLGSAGHDVTVKAVPDAEAAAADLIVADLEAVDAEAVAAIGPPTLGFYSHVDVDTRRAAEEAGFDMVVPRSRMSRELPELAERLLSG